MKKLIFITALLTMSSAFGKSLECTDAPSFTGRGFSITRDGSIGFNGTYITMESQGVWHGVSDYKNLSDITGRAADEKLSLTGLTLAIHPKEACTNPEADVQTPFKCSAKNVTIIARGEGSEQDGAIFDRITLNSQLRADVDVELVPIANTPHVELVLRGTVNAAGKVLEFEIPVKDQNKHCKVTGSLF